MKVLDRQNLEKVIAEGESGYYADESNFVQLGTVANVQYVLNGSLQKTGSGFSLQLKITDAASGASKAAYTGNVPAAELEDLSGVKKASAELLAQLGVSLTDAGRAVLLGAASSSAIQAETALARGITAQRSGTVIEALSYYYEAAKFDPGLAEAASRSSVLSADIQGGNIGQNVRNDIQRRAAWVKTLDEAAAFFKDHPPLELIYDPALTTGRIDYDKETTEMSFEAKLISTTGMKIIYDLDQGLEKTGRSEEWKIGVDSIYKAIPTRYEFNAALTNEDGETIGSTMGRLELTGYNRNFDYNYGHNDVRLRFSGVDANKITDSLTVSIVSVNGMDAKTSGERGYMSISTEDFAPLEDSFLFDWLFGAIKITRRKDLSENLVIPAKISRWLVTTIEAGAFQGYSYPLASVTIPDSVTSIGDYAFIDNHLTSVTIPHSVTSIGYSAFYNNRLVSATIPDSVTSIRSGAFGHNRLVSTTIPDSVTSIEVGAFSDNQLASVVIGNSVASIGENAFYNNPLTSVAIPDSVTFIDRNAFYNNPLASVTLPANVQWDVSRINYLLSQAYESNGKKAGTYVRVGDTNNWRMR
jgi:hypothetical protein